MGPGAGDTGAHRRARAGILALASCLMVQGCAEMIAEAERDSVRQSESSSPIGAPASASATLLALPPLLGANLVTRTDPAGMPRPGAARGFLRLTHPSAVAAWGPDVYVVDQGTASLYRIDATTQAMQQIAAVPSVPGTRIAAAPDGTAYVVQPGSASVRRYARDGRLLDTLAAPGDLVNPTDLAFEPRQGLLWVADGTLQQIVAFHPAGRLAYVVSQRGNADSRLETGLKGLTAVPGSAFVVDPACHCVGEMLPDGRGLRRFGERDLVRPLAVAADRWGRAWVIDAGDRRIKAFFDGVLSASLALRELNVVEPNAITISDDTLYLADGAGARVAVFRIVPQPAGSVMPK